MLLLSSERSECPFSVDLWADISVRSRINPLFRQPARIAYVGDNHKEQSASYYSLKIIRSVQLHIRTYTYFSERERAGSDLIIFLDRKEPISRRPSLQKQILAKRISQRLTSQRLI